MLKKFSLFEAKLKGNPAIPEDFIEEYSKKMSSSSINPRQMMGLINQMLQIQMGKEEQLKELGLKAVNDFYGDIISDVEIDAKIVIPGRDAKHTEMRDKIREKQKDREKKNKEEKSPEQKKALDKLKEMMKKAGLSGKEEENKNPEEKIDVSVETAKRKIVNNIIQGESFNIFNIISLIKDDIDKIDRRLFNLYRTIIDESYKMYWMMDEKDQVEMFMNDPKPIGNFVQVDWKQKEGDGECSSCKAANDAMEDAMDGEGIENNPEEAKEALSDMNSPTIIARALDLPSMIHEIVKGIYELIASHAIGEDLEKEKAIKSEVTSYEDEIEDLRYGPKIAADLRDFINQNPKHGKVKNMREFVFSKLVDSKLLSDDEFLKVMKGILSNKPEDKDLKVIARTIIDRFVDEIVEEHEEYEESLKKYNLEQTLGSYEDEKEDEKEDDVDDKIAKLMASTKQREPKETPKKETPKPKEVSKMTEKDYMYLQQDQFKRRYMELEKEINNAFDSDDMAKVRELGQERKLLVDTFNKKYDITFDAYLDSKKYK